MLFFPSHTTETDKGLILKTTINFFDKKVLPPFTAGFIFYQVTKKKIPLFKNISKITQKRINFYSPILLLTLYSLFRVLNQQELINKKQLIDQLELDATEQKQLIEQQNRIEQQKLDATKQKQLIEQQNRIEQLELDAAKQKQLIDQLTVDPHNSRNASENSKRRKIERYDNYDNNEEQ